QVARAAEGRASAQADERPGDPELRDRLGAGIQGACSEPERDRRASEHGGDGESIVAARRRLELEQPSPPARPAYGVDVPVDASGSGAAQAGAAVETEQALPVVIPAHLGLAARRRQTRLHLRAAAQVAGRAQTERGSGAERGVDAGTEQEPSI